jgi:hypothetical protein
MFIVGLLAFSIGMIIYVFDGHTIVKKQAEQKYKTIQQLSGTNRLSVRQLAYYGWIGSKIICKLYWMSFLHWANNTVEHVDHKTSIISYVLHGKHYRFVAKANKGPSNVLLIIDENDVDVTDLVLPFYGPNRDWHKRSFSPIFWKKNKLTFEMASGDQKTFYANDEIVLD